MKRSTVNILASYIDALHPINAAARNSEYTAKVLEPNGNGYAKNSVDIMILWAYIIYI